jgi:hypothetical protein
MNHSTMTRQGFVPYGPSLAGAEALSRIMSPIVWLASAAAAGVHDERIVATEFEGWRRGRTSAVG